MTYDKENSSGMDRVQRSGRTRDQHAGSPMLEGERVVMSRPGRQKRKSFTYETKLTGISETYERKRSTNTINEISGRNDQRVEESLCEFENRRKCDKSDTKKNLSETNQDKGDQIGADGLYDERNIDEMSHSTSTKSRRSSGSDVRYSEKHSIKSNSGRKNRTTTAEMESDFNISERLKDSDKENIPSDDEFAERKHLRPLKDKEGTGSHGSDLKLPDVKCQHLAASKAIETDAALKKKLKLSSLDQVNPDKCMICEITEATANYASVEANRLLLEIVYPHEFYDRFQRSGRRAKDDTKNLEISKMPITIGKSVKVAPKVLSRERSSFSFKPSVAEKLGISNQSKNFPSDASDTEQSPQKRIKTDSETGFKKEIHLKCKAKRNALVITDDSEGQKLVLKGLKGWITRKEDTCRNTVHKEIKQSLYQVNSLGIQFSIPGYNPSRSEKKLQSPRPFTCLETPRPSDIHQAIRRPITGNFSPRSRSDESTDVCTDQVMPQHPLRLRRSYTNVPKLFADSAGTEPPSDLKTANEQISNSSKKTFDNGLTFYEKSKTRLSLPPIGNDFKTRSLTLGQF